MIMIKNKKGFQFNDFEITKREILASVSIIAILLLIGVLISGKISEYEIETNEKYNKAVKIESINLFQYGMDTNIGNAFVYGDLKAVDTVTYPEIGGEYNYIKKVEEHYNIHTRTYTTTDGKGHTQTHTQVYWSWDYAGKEQKKCKEISFCGIAFNSNKINYPKSEYIDMIKESSHVRYKYYGVATKFTGTIFTVLKDKTISDNSAFYNNMKIDQVVEHLESDFSEIGFWIIWVIFIAGIVFWFFYLDNKWLD